MDLPNEGRTPKGHVAVRLDDATIARVDALRSRYELPGREATRSDALRALLLTGLEVEEKRGARRRSRRG